MYISNINQQKAMNYIANYLIVIQNIRHNNNKHFIRTNLSSVKRISKLSLQINIITR